MAILTLAEFKASGTYLLNTAAFPTDATTSQLVQESEDSYLSVRGRAFKKITGSYTNGSAVISDIKYYDMVGLKKTMRISGDSIRGEIIDVDFDNLRVTLDANATGTATAEEMDVYPEQSLNVAIQIVKYLRSQYVTDLTKKSESIEKHSWTNWGTMDVKSGLPMSIASRIKSLASVKEGARTGKGYWKGQEEKSVYDKDVEIRSGEVDVTT